MSREYIPIELICQYFLAKGLDNGKPTISNKKLQKLLYYAQGWHLALTGKALFKEKIEAWVHGPAIRDVYTKYKEYSFRPIEYVVASGDLDKIPADVRKFLDDVYKVYGKFDAKYLELLTHSERPWQEARKNLEPFVGSESEITTDSMKEFYSQKLAEHKKKS